MYSAGSLLRIDKLSWALKEKQYRENYGGGGGGGGGGVGEIVL